SWRPTTWATAAPRRPRCPTAASSSRGRKISTASGGNSGWTAVVGGRLSSLSHGRRGSLGGWPSFPRKSVGARNAHQRYTMTLHPRSASRLGLGLFSVFGLLPLWPAPVPADPPGSREQQITDLERQLDALKKRLEEVRAAPTAPAAVHPEESLPADWV